MILKDTMFFKHLLYLINNKDVFQKTAEKSREVYTHVLFYVCSIGILVQINWNPGSDYRDTKLPL